MSRVVIAQPYVPEYRVAFFTRLRAAAAAEGIEVDVAYGRPDPAQAARADAATLDFGIELDQREWRIAGRRVVVRRLAAAVAGADLVVLEQARRNLDAYTMLLPRHRRTALWGHGRDYTRRAGRFDGAVQRALTRRADWFFAYTEGGADAVAAAGLPRDRITVVQNTADTASLRAAVRTADTSAVDAELGLRGRTALFIGGLDAAKRLPMLLGAGQRAAEADADFRLVVAGDGAERPAIEQAAASSTWLRYVGPVSGARKASLLAAAQIVAMPGRVGLVAVDAFAARTPILTTCWPYHAPEFEYLADGENALIVPDDEAAFAQAMISVLRDGDRLARLAAGCDAAADRVSIDAMVDNFLAGLRAALAVRT